MEAGFVAARRSREAEWMDGADVSDADMAALLSDLARVNTLLAGRRPTLRWLARQTRGWPAGAGFSLIDVGAGQGDMLRAIAGWAKGRGLMARLTGYDLNARCTDAARAATDPALPISFVTADATTAPSRPDFIVSALTTHHMADQELVRFLRWMDATAARGWFVNDLHRHPIAYHAFRALGWVARLHPTVRHDGAVSVARGFTRADWHRLAEAAGVSACVAWHPMFRWGVERA